MKSRAEKWNAAKRFAKRHGMNSTEAHTILNRNGWNIAAARREVRCVAAAKRAAKILSKLYRVTVCFDFTVNKK